MRIAYFDPFSGASGDMILGALLDAGLSEAALRSDLGKIELPGYSMSVQRTERQSITGTHVTVTPGEDQPHRHWSDIRTLIEESALDAPVRDAALAIFARLAEAEAGVHGTSPEEVHFHEVGGVDAIVDICGACIGLALLGVDAIFSGPPRLGSGFVHAAHGLLPVPAPATASLLARANVPTAGPDPGTEAVQVELLTPTGAAILSTLAEFRRPDFVPNAIGYGLGTRDLPWPNALRVWIGEMAGDGASDDDGDLLLETNIDDMNPQFFELLSERLFAAGAARCLADADHDEEGPPCDPGKRHCSRTVPPRTRGHPHRQLDDPRSPCPADRAGQSGPPNRVRHHAMGRGPGKAAWLERASAGCAPRIR